MAALLIGAAWILTPTTTPWVSDEGGYILFSRVVLTGSARSLPPGFDARHPLYPLLLAGAHSVLGNRGYVLLSAVGGWAAAVMSAKLAQHLRSTLGPATLWLVGLTSPLAFYSFLAVAHTLAAVSATAAVFFLVGALKDPRRMRLSSVVGFVVGIASLDLLRSEGILFSGAIVLAAVAMAWVAPKERARWAAMASLAGVTIVVTRLSEGRWVARFGGAAALPYVPHAGSAARISTQLQNTAQNLLWPWPPSHVSGATHFLLGAVLILPPLILGLAARAGTDRRILLTSGAVGVVCYATWCGYMKSPLSGLLVAWPILLTGLMCLRWRSAWSSSAVRVIVFTSAAFGAGVAAISTDGGFQWGGRYYSAALPILAPLVVFSFSQLDNRTRRVTIAISLAMVTIIVSFGIESEARQRSLNARLVQGLQTCARTSQTFSATAASAKPVVVVPSIVIPPIAWATYDLYDWRVSETPSPHALLHNLRSSDTVGLTVIGSEPAELADLDGYVKQRTCPAGWATAFALTR